MNAHITNLWTIIPIGKIHIKIRNATKIEINKDKGFAPIVGYLNKSVQLIKDGLFDNNLQELLVKYRERAEKGIQAKKDKKNAEKLKLAS